MADDDDDPQLRPLRAAWRSMPDEDPPERGLDELMAAARQQAGVMAEARAPWWKRLAATLLRPPVLALASVLILLGGLFVVTSSQKGVSPEPTPIEQSSAPAASVPSAGAGSAAAATTSDTTIAPPVAKTPQQPPVAAPAPAPARQRAPTHHAAALPKAPARGLEEVAPAKPAPAMAPEAATPPVVEPAPTAGAAFEDDGNAAPATTRSPVKKLPAADVDAAETPRHQLDDQLLAQCRAAATRGDCEVARQLAKRISNDDAAYYQAHVVGDATIAPCLRP
ncbi:MAG TPA: hypothetical protein VGG74_13330 [Kofleriaceae bacterium]|jgi:hypothetical protein